MTVFFDLDRTLMDFESAENLGIKAVFDKYNNEISMDLEAFIFQWKKWAQHFFDKYSAGELTFDAQRKMRIKKIFELNGFPLSDENELEERFYLYWSTYEKEYKLFEDALPLLKKLQALNIPMGIITNGDSSNQRSKLERAGINKFFDTIIISSEVGISKPDFNIFYKAMEQAGTSLSETWYVGDSPDHDIKPSVKLGINTFYLNRKRNGIFYIQSEKPFYAEIKDFYEMMTILEKRYQGN